jgi:excisionase family DNA binding protein
MRESVRRELMDFRTRQLRRALEPLRDALESHHRSLEELESALIEFEEALIGLEKRPERPQAQQRGGEGGGHLNLLSIMDVCQELGMGKSWVYRRIQSGEIPSVKLGHNIKVRREDLEEYLEGQRTALSPQSPQSQPRSRL